jgi:hypothetical protein
MMTVLVLTGTILSSATAAATATTATTTSIDGVGFLLLLLCSKQHKHVLKVASRKKF